jgi:hypothetical protein
MKHWTLPLITILIYNVFWNLHWDINSQKKTNQTSPKQIWILHEIWKVPTASSMHSTTRLSHIKRIPPEASPATRIDQPVKVHPTSPKQYRLNLLHFCFLKTHYIRLPYFQQAANVEPFPYIVKCSNIPTNNFKFIMGWGLSGVLSEPKFIKQDKFRSSLASLTPLPISFLIEPHNPL